MVQKVKDSLTDREAAPKIYRTSSVNFAPKVLEQKLTEIDIPMAFISSSKTSSVKNVLKHEVHAMN